MSKLDLAVIVAFIGGAVLWIEHEHRVFIDAPAPAESAVASAGRGLPGQRQRPVQRELPGVHGARLRVRHELADERGGKSHTAAGHRAAIIRAIGVVRR